MVNAISEAILVRCPTQVNEKKNLGEDLLFASIGISRPRFIGLLPFPQGRWQRADAGVEVGAGRGHGSRLFVAVVAIVAGGGG